MKLTFLGTGTSHGIPVPGCTCRVCRSSDPRDRRMRSSILLEKDGKTLVVDTGPEFRLQALRAKLMHLDAVLYTHAHADHINGLDDLRPYCVQKTLDIYGDARVRDHVKTCFPYVLHQASDRKDRLPHLSFHLLAPYQSVSIAGFSVTPLILMHGALPIYGYRIDNLVYATDCNRIPERSRPFMAHAGLLVLDALRPSPHPTHFSIDEALSEARSLDPKECYLIHFCHEVSHQDLVDRLGARLHPSYDSLSVEVDPCE